MVKYNQELIDSIYSKRTEVHYNEWKIQNSKVELKGKIKCPLLNTNISSFVCSKLMSRPDWPRGIDIEVCQKCNCFIYRSIERFSKEKRGPINEQKS